ncbi:condensation domain-containing protein, partial [Sphaerisporangium corydalis]
MSVVSGDDRLRDLLNRRVAAARRSGADGIPRRGDDGPWRLSPVQRRLWLAGELDLADPSYNVPLVLRLRGDLDVAALRSAVTDLAGRHSVLRSTVQVRDGEPYAVPGPAEAVPVHHEHFATAAELERRIAELSMRPFRPADEPPMRATIITAGPREHVLVLLLHHMAVDAWAQPLLLDDLAALYRHRAGAGPALDPPALDYSDAAAWLNARAVSPQADRALDWWAERLAGLEPAPGFQPGTPETRSITPGGAMPAGVVGAGWRGDSVEVVVPRETVAGVRALASAHNATVFMVLLAAMRELQARVSGTDDVAVGVPEAGRRHPDTERVMGCFLETLVIRGSADHGLTGAELVRQVRGEALDAFGHADVPFDRVVERVRPPRTGAGAPLFDVLLNVYDAPGPVTGFPGVTAELVEVPPFAAKFGQTWTFADDGDDLRCTLGYRSEAFDEGSARRLAGWFVALLSQLARDPGRPVDEWELEPGRVSVLSGPVVPVLGASTVHGRIRARALRAPSAPAVRAVDGSLTYGELEGRARALAGRLRAVGVVRGDRVMVLMERTVDMPVALVGVMKAGAAYVPVDETTPAGRVAQILATAGVRVAVCAPGLEHLVPSHVTVLPATTESDVQAGAAFTPVVPDTEVDICGGGDVAYVVFTSGSTGGPKGVVVEHGGLVGYLDGVFAGLGGGLVSFGLVST